MSDADVRLSDRFAVLMARPVTDSVTVGNEFCNRYCHQPSTKVADSVAAMVTRTATKRVYLKEHRKARGVSAADMAKKLGIERESVYRLENKPWGVNAQKQAAYAAAIGIEPQELWRKPDDPSLDHIVSRAPADVRESIEKIIRRIAPETK